MEAVILLGAPGAGKGTAAEGIIQHTDYVHLATGNLLREAIAAGTELGRKAKAFMSEGELVPDDVVMGMVTERFAGGPSDAHYLCDGFPRTVEQARLLDGIFNKINARLRFVFVLEAPPEVSVMRISGRRICKDCGAVYHVTNIPPRVEGVCDSCGGELYQRVDDNEETVRNRLEVYRRQTASLVDYYDKKGLLTRIDASGHHEGVEKEILGYLSAEQGT